nr:MAG TPA: hypothetical protein [Caudoviricetes sp.]
MATTTTKKEDVIEEVTTKKAEQKTSKIDDAIALMAQLMQTMASNQMMASVTNVAKPEGKIKIVHLAQMDPSLGTNIHLSNLYIGMTEFGEERELTTQQFEELLSKHRGWFAKGLLCVAKGYEEEAKKYGVTTVSDCPIDKTFIKTLGDIPMSRIEEVYGRLPEYGQENLVSYWLRCAYDGDPRFRDIRRVKTFNDITGGKLENLLVELDRKPSNTQTATRPNIVRY